MHGEVVEVGVGLEAGGELVDGEVAGDEVFGVVEAVFVGVSGEPVRERVGLFGR